MADQSSPSPPAGKNQSRTQALAALAPPDQTGRQTLMITCGTIIIFAAIFAFGCAFLNVLEGFVNKPSIAVVAAFNASIMVIPYAAIILWLDRNEKEPPALLITAFLWGAIMATGASCVVNTFFGSVTNAILMNPAASGQLTASIIAPFIEEITKGMALLVIWLFFRKEFDNVLDGIVYGAIVGLGFAGYENFIYYVRCETIYEVFQLTWLRGVVAGVGSHACYTALFGGALGLFRVMRKGAARWIFPPLGLGMAMFAHFAWNTFTGFFIRDGASDAEVLLVSVPLAALIIHIPFVLFILAVSGFALRHEKKIITGFLAEEKEPIIFEAERAFVLPPRRTLHNFVLLLTLKWGSWWRRRKRNQLLVKLAFEKWHMDREHKLEQTEYGHYHATRILKLRKKLTEASPLDL